MYGNGNSSLETLLLTVDMDFRNGVVGCGASLSREPRNDNLALVRITVPKDFWKHQYLD